MSDTNRTPSQPDEKKQDDNVSGDCTPDDWFRSPTVKTLKRRQLQLGTYNTRANVTFLCT